jgi:hypothetical protein
MTSYDSCGDFQPFQYTPLTESGTNIRLLKILPDHEYKSFGCIIEEADLNCDFVCLSYMWGNDEASHPILLNGKPILVRDNLWFFLLQARKVMANTDLPLWIDALCINQQDENEKSAQVMLMGDIYKRANELMIWLGEGNAKIESALDIIARREYVGNFLEREIEQSHVQAFSNIACLQYWTRMCTYDLVIKSAYT